MDNNCDIIEMQDQGDKDDGTLEEGQTIVVQADIEEEEATPLLEKFTAIEMQEQTKETGENLEKGPSTVAVQADLEGEKCINICWKHKAIMQVVP